MNTNLYRDEVGNLIQIISRPTVGSQFDYLWTAVLIDDGPGKGMRFSFDSGDVGFLYSPVVLELSA